MRQHSRRRPPADSLQRRQHLRDHGLTLAEGDPQFGFLLLQRAQARFARGQPLFDVAQLAGGVEQSLVELAAIVPE